ncbi:MAG: hypothetical protein HGA19_24295, partial [Oscillochloris sp.]|nr:hypothetical protein [Oscillochloris sp.]
GCLGISYFHDDDNLSRLMRVLHDWAAPGSIMALSFISGKTVTEENHQTQDLFKRNGAAVYSRDLELIQRVIAPWTIREIKPLATWLGAEHLIQESDRENTDTEMYGAVLDHAG